MAVDKMSVSLVQSLSNAVRDAAEQSGETLSGWLADAAQAKLRSQALDAFLDVWESENEAFSEEEIREAAARLGVVEATTTGSPILFKLVALEGRHEDLVATITHIIEGGYSVLVSEQDLTDIARMMRAGEPISLERADIRVTPPTK